MVPNGWTTAQVKDLCSRVSVGIVVQPSQYYVDNGVGTKAFRSANVREGRVNDNDWVYISDEGNKKNVKSILQENDVLVVRSGYPGTACVVPKEYAGANCIDIIFARPETTRIIPNYLCLFTNSEHGRKQTLSSQGGLAQKHLNVGAYSKMEIPLPPLPEQKKIARILSTWDKAIETVEKLIENSTRQKKALMQQLLTGKKRLPGFSGSWRHAHFNNIFTVANEKHKQVKSGDYLIQGEHPIVDQSQTLIAGYTNSGNVYTNLPVIIFGDHTRVIKWIDFPFAPGADGTQILKAKSNIDARFAYFALQNVRVPNLGYSRHLRELKEKRFFYPVEKEEQKAIANLLFRQENTIQALENYKECLAHQKKALMQQLLTGKRRVKVNDIDRTPAQAG